MWGLYLVGHLVAKYDNFRDALQDAVNTYNEVGLMHELKRTDEEEKEVSMEELEELLKNDK